MHDPSSVPFVFPDFTGRKLLVLGLGGGCDVITAFALARLLEGRSGCGIVYGNTKQGSVGPNESVTAHVRRLFEPPPAAGRPRLGRSAIDRSVPRGPEESPWVFLLDDETAEQELPGEIRSLGFDAVIGVDTGGDSIAGRPGRKRLGRDRRMLRVLQRTGLPLLHVVAAPGSDGECSFEEVRAALRAQTERGCSRGCFSLEPILPDLRALSGPLSPVRTARIILAAADGQLESTPDGRLVVPRGRRPAVTAGWLTTGFVFEPESAPAG